ncbi:hypothetical protein V2J56_15145, partial [Georgenia sp. MJ206]
ADALALLAHTALDTGWIGTPTPDDQHTPPTPPTQRDDDGPSSSSDSRRSSSSDGRDDGNGNGVTATATGTGVDASTPDNGELTGTCSEDAAVASSDLGAETAADAQDAPTRRQRPRDRMRLAHIGGHRTHVRVTVPLSVLLPPPPPGTASQSRTPDHAPGTAPPSTATGSPPDPAATPPDNPPGTAPPSTALSSTATPGTAAPGSPGAAGVTGAAGVPGTADVPAAPDVPDEDLIPCLELPPCEVAELEGYGPITPDVARALAA